MDHKINTYNVDKASEFKTSLWTLVTCDDDAFAIRTFSRLNA